MIEFYKGFVRKLVTPTEKQEIGAKYPMASSGSPNCSAKTSPTGLMRHCWICTRPTHHDGPHVAHRNDKALAIWGIRSTDALRSSSTVYGSVMLSSCAESWKRCR